LSAPSYQYDRVSKLLTVTMNGRKHKVGHYGDAVTASRAAKAFIEKQQQQQPDGSEKK